MRLFGRDLFAAWRRPTDGAARQAGAGAAPTVPASAAPPSASSPPTAPATAPLPRVDGDQLRALSRPPPSDVRSPLRARLATSVDLQGRVDRLAGRLQAAAPRLLEVRRGESTVRRYEVEPGLEVAFRTGYEGAVEAAASNLAVRVGVDLVPAAVPARIDGADGFAQEWIPSKTGLDLGDDILVRAWQSPRFGARDRSDALVFILLVGTRDVHAGNWAVREPDGRPVLFDFAGGLFDLWDEDYEGEKLAAIETIRLDLYERLRGLSAEEVPALFSPMTTVPWFDMDRAVRGLLLRRDRILQRVDDLVATKGKAAVFV